MKLDVQTELCKAAYSLGALHAKLGKPPRFPIVEVLVDSLRHELFAPKNELESYRNGYGQQINDSFNQAIKGSGDPNDVFYPHPDGRSFDTKQELEKEWFKEAAALDLDYRRALRSSVMDRRLTYYDGISPILVEDVELFSSADAPPAGALPTDYSWNADESRECASSI